MTFCGNCGASITQGSGFCGSCDKPVNAASDPVVATATPAQAVSSGNAGWTPMTTPSAPPPPATPRPDTMSWSAVPNGAPQNSEWSSVPPQPLPAANAAQAWNGAAASPAAAVAPAVTPAAGTGLTRNIAAALAYSLGIITGILFLVLEPYRRDRFVRFHAFQSIFYFVFAIAFSIAWGIAVSMLASFSGWIIVAAFPIRMIIRLAMFGLWLYAMFQAYNEREFRIPFLGAIASKQAQS